MSRSGAGTWDSPAAAPRRRIRVQGIVQGVGFRPFVYRLAHEMSLSGWVRNDVDGVAIEAQGSAAALDLFQRRLRSEAPTGARVDAIDAEQRPGAAGECSFAILDTAAGPARTAIGPDTAVCPQCLAELFDPCDRRHRYALINCTACGPRYTLTRGLPYDRAQTSMAGYPLCPACAAEYAAPGDRRFHAEPNACPTCGPRLGLLDAGGRPLPGDPVAAALALLRAGAIVAVKGLGGFHLACDARRAGSVHALRQRKQREEKPLAILVQGLAAARRWADLDAREEEALASPQRPIVLARKRPGVDGELPGVAPGVAWLGLMLPYTPLHYLLFHEHAGRPRGLAWLEDGGTRADGAQLLTLVMTSANPGGEPLVHDDARALQSLRGIADAFLLHDRQVVVRCDDSVLRVRPVPHFVRRARGFTPQAIRLAGRGPAVLALGGHLKSTVCLTRGDEAFVSQHLGDLDNGPTCEALDEAVLHLRRLLACRPDALACDLHPDFYSTRHALALAAAEGLRLVQVQHHHAHIGAVLAEHRAQGPVLGLALDGVGLGDDGGAWGGELLRVDGQHMARLGHLRPLAQPGGDRAAREPWRMAAAALHLLGRDPGALREAGPTAGTGPGADARRAVAQMLQGGRHCPPTTSMGRCFDAAAGLLGVRNHASFEGQAAMLLEGLAEGAGEHEAMAPGRGWTVGDDGTLDLLPLLATLVDEEDVRRGARRFHATLAAALADWVGLAVRASGLRRVVLGGGCFQNGVLLQGLRPRLLAQGLEVLGAGQLPPNDGGLSLGQAWVARQRLR